MVQQVAVYKTADGAVFDTVEEAKHHEAGLRVQQGVADYHQHLIGQGLEVKAASRRANAVKEYLIWSLSRENVVE